MYVIKEISDKDFNLKYQVNQNTLYSVRKAVRAIVNNKDKIAVIYIKKDNYYKLPGGGIERGESVKDALKRELLEETGCIIQMEKELGMTIEFRNKINQKQISYVYMGVVKNDSGKIQFTEDEVNNGATLEWITKDELIKVFENNTTSNYIGKFICERDKAIVRYFTNS